MLSGLFEALFGGNSNKRELDLKAYERETEERKREMEWRAQMERENPFHPEISPHASPSGRYASASPGGYFEALRSGRNVAR